MTRLSWWNVPAVGHGSIIVAVIHLEPMVQHTMATVGVERNEEHRLHPFARLQSVAHCSTHVLIALPVEPFWGAMLAEHSSASFLDSWQCPQPEPLLKLDLHEAMTFFAINFLHDHSMLSGMKLQSKRGAEAGRHMEADDVQHKLETLCPERFPASRSNQIKCYRCDCGHKACHKVMRRSTVRKKADRSRFQCPVHVDGYPTNSSYVAIFAENMKRIDPTARIIWDWRCFPKRKNMSIDATVLHGHKCSNFEIDGEGHFNERECTREAPDHKKDIEVYNCGCGLMRLHYKDRYCWEKYIRHHLACPKGSMQCTPSYREFMDGHAYEPKVLSAADVSKDTP